MASIVSNHVRIFYGQNKILLHPPHLNEGPWDGVRAVLRAPTDPAIAGGAKALGGRRAWERAAGPDGAALPNNERKIT